MKINSMPQTPTLFLHMGPGLHARVEKKVLGDRFGNIHFWDQPYISEADKNRAFSVLSTSAAIEVEKLYSKHNAPIAVLAHSFGGHLVRPLLESSESKISSCHFVSTGFNLPSGFFYLLKTMRDAPDTDLELKKKLNKFTKKELTSYESLMSHFWEMINFVAADPAYIRHYWPDRNQFLKYIELLQGTPALDFGTFQYVLNDFLNHHLQDTKPYLGPVPIRIFLGGLDPLLDVKNEKESWARIYPSSEISILPNSGHFIHLEEYL